MQPKLVRSLTSHFSSTLLTRYADHVDLGRVVGTAAEAHLPTSAPEPDIFFVKTEHLWRPTAERLIGLADLAVEFVSDDGLTRDCRDKVEEYAPGIPKY